jgi:hypothetical protein
MFELVPLLNSELPFLLEAVGALKVPISKVLTVGNELLEERLVELKTTQ